MNELENQPETKPDKLYYMIKVPSLSNGLKKSYNKQLHVYEMVEDDVNDERMANWAKGFRSINRWELKKGKWIVKKDTTEFHRGLREHKLRHEVVTHTNGLDPVLAFEDLELAKASKIMLVHNLKNEYQEAVQNILNTMERNVPDLTKEVEQLKEQMPELFI